MISGAIGQAEAKTHVFTVFEQSDSVLETAKTNKSDRINKRTSDKTIAANSRISNIYVQANCEKDNLLQKIFELLQNRDITQSARLLFPGRKKLIHLALTRITYYISTNGALSRKT